MQDFLLINLIILLGCQMNQLKQEIVDIQIDGITGHAHLLHFFIQMRHTFPNLNFVILFNGSDQRIQTAFAQYDAALIDLYLCFVKVYLFLHTKGLERFEDAGSPIGLGDSGYIRNPFPCQHMDRMLENFLQTGLKLCQIFCLSQIVFCSHIITINKANIVAFSILRYIKDTVCMILLQIFLAGLIELALHLAQDNILFLLFYRKISKFDIDISDPFRKLHMFFYIFQIHVIIFGKQKGNHITCQISRFHLLLILFIKTGALRHMCDLA